MEKQMLAAGHADGKVEAVCQNCQVPFDWVITGSGPDTDEEYRCPNCGHPATMPRKEYETLAEELLYRWPSNWPVFHEYVRCPECGSVGECIVNEKMIDIQVRVFSCTQCDSFWRVEER